MRLLIIIPLHNALTAMDATILSLLAQEGDFTLHLRLCDLGSGDGTAERLAEWERRIASGAVPHGATRLIFDRVAKPGLSPLAAVGAALEDMPAGGGHIITWLSPGAVLLPGALALAASLGRRFAPHELGFFGNPGTGPGIKAGTESAGQLVAPALIPTEAVAAGQADGQNWPRLAQPGIFLRRMFWEGVAEEGSEPAFWSALARRTRFVLVPAPLAQAAPDDALASASEPAPLPPAGDLRARVLRPHGPEGALAVVEEAIHGPESGPHHDPAPKARVIWRGRPLVSPFDAGALVLGPGLVGHDAQWQSPAITEAHAFARIRAMGGLTGGVTYFGFPFATLIDKLQGGAKDAHDLLAAWRATLRHIPPGSIAVTTCQHIHLRRYGWLLAEAGISHAFWSHAGPNEEPILIPGRAPVTLHPFPLYPVQRPEVPPGPPLDGPRRWLFSFVGARAGPHYPRPTRNLILDLLKDDPRGHVEGRDVWHFGAEVYGRQVRAQSWSQGPVPETDHAASARFAQVMGESTFALCPAGTGPNSIRLWEALAFGAIPVLLADGWDPPGDPRLWAAAMVRAEESREAIEALPQRLAEIAADPARLATMRAAGRQIAMLYGSGGFVGDMLELAQKLAEPAPPPAPGDRIGRALAGFMGEGEAAPLLTEAATALLLGGILPDGIMARTGSPLSRALAAAKAALPADHPARCHFDRVRALRAAAVPASAPIPAPITASITAPWVNRGAPPVVALIGQHRHRTPLAYAPIARAIGGRLHFTKDPAMADLILAGFNVDLQAEAAQIATACAGPRRPKVMVLSEEPLWDSQWSKGFADRNRVVERGEAAFPYLFLNHQTSRIFDFQHLPWQVLTSEALVARYALWSDRHAAEGAEALLDHWERAPVPAGFFAERRKGEEVDWPDLGVHPLSGWRTRLAEALGLPGVVRQGKGWPETTGPRQNLPDWHLDKIAQLGGRVRYLGCHENTHQRNYVSEKVFDAFVVGAVPLYWAGPGHRIHDLIRPEAMVNGQGLTPEAAAAQIIATRPGRAMAEAWIESARGLAARFRDAPAIARERARMADEILSEIGAALDG